jgi:hypothetical protein
MSKSRSIFSWIRDKLEQDYGGRYFSTALQATLEFDPRFARYIFSDFGPKFSSQIIKGLTCGEYQITIEWPYVGRSGKHRRADLAITSTADKKRPIAILEVKYEDHQAKSNLEQTRDYLGLLKQFPECKLVILSKHRLPEQITGQLKRAGGSAASVLWNRIFLRAHEKNNSPIIEWMLAFIKEESMIFHQKLIQRDLRYLMRGGLALPGTGAVGKVLTIEAVRSGPEQMAQLQSNADILCRYIQGICGVGFSQLPRPYFNYHPWLKVDAKGESDGFNRPLNNIAMTFPEKSRIGGEACFGSRTKLKISNSQIWSALEVYYHIEVYDPSRPKAKKRTKVLKKQKKKNWALDVYLCIWAGTDEKADENYSADELYISIKRPPSLEKLQEWLAKSAKKLFRELAKKHPEAAVRKAFGNLHKAIKI